MNTATTQQQAVQTILEFQPPQEYADLWWAAYLGNDYPVYSALRGMYNLFLSGIEIRASIGTLTLGMVASVAGVSREKAVVSLASLRREGVVYAHTAGSGRKTAYQFDVVVRLPLLTPKQVCKLPKPVAVAHAANLSLFDGVLPRWHDIVASTLVDSVNSLVRVP